MKGEMIHFLILDARMAMAVILHVCSCPSSYCMLCCAAVWHYGNLLTVLSGMK